MSETKNYRLRALFFGSGAWPGEESSGSRRLGNQNERRAPKRHWRDWFAPYVDVM